MYENTLLPSRTKAWSSIASSSFHQRLQHLGGLIKRQESLLASGLQICQLMTKIFNPYARIVGLAGILCLLSVQIPVMAASPSQDSQKARSGDAQQLVKAFEERVKEYVKLREQLEEKLPKLSKEAKPEEIETHKKALQEMVRAARAGAKPGDIFTPDIASHIRTTIKREFRGKDLQELRETILEAETKGVPVRVNHPYPATKELAEMPPTLLLILPQLPKQVRYRYVGRHMLLVDRENGLIIDYMLDALP